MKDVTVVSVNKLASAGTTHQQPRCEPTIKESGNSADSAGLRGVCMNQIRLFADKQPVELPDSRHVVQGNFTTHLRDEMGNHTSLLSEIAHVAFTWGYRPGHQHRLVIRKTGGQPHYMFRRSTDIQSCDDSYDLCSVRL